MQAGERDRLRAAAAMLETLAQQLAGTERSEIPGGDFRLLAQQVERIEAEFPGLLPPFDSDYFRGRFSPQFHLYEASRVQHWLGVALTTLRSAIERATSDPLAAQPTQPPDFSFVNDDATRAIVQRDFGEIERGLAHGCWKSVIILAGGMLEALLVDALVHAFATRSDLSDSAPRNVSRMRFEQLIEKAGELRLVSSGVKKLSDTLRQYRNLVHAGAELRNQLRVDEDEARLAVIILRIASRDLAASPR